MQTYLVKPNMNDNAFLAAASVLGADGSGFMPGLPSGFNRHLNAAKRQAEREKRVPVDCVAELQKFHDHLFKHSFTGQERHLDARPCPTDGRVTFYYRPGGKLVSTRMEPRKALNWIKNAVNISDKGWTVDP
jgi:hypothetical protein